MPVSHPSLSSHANTAALVCAHVTFERGGETVLDDVSLKVSPLSRVGVVRTQWRGQVHAVADPRGTSSS
jgi:ABC-type multidrug transport system fused ATPase/permease subunit